MATTESISFVYRDDNGELISGATIWLRGSTDNFASDLYQLTEQVGLPGSYAANIEDMPFQKYKTWINASENKVFGGANGQWRGNPFTVFALKSVLTALSETVTALIATVAGKVSKAGVTNESISTPLTFTQQRPNRDDGIATGNYSTITDFVCFDDLFEYVANLTAGIEYFKMVFVIPGKPNKAGKQYGTILEAANYLHTQVPTVDKRCAIVVCNNSLNLPYILASEGSFRDDYVDWYGLGKKIKVVPETQNISKIMLLKNFTMILKADIGARILQYMDWDDMHIHGYASRTFKGGTMDKTRILGEVGTTTTFAKDTADVTCQVLDTITNIEPARVDPDTYSPLPDIKVIAGLRLEADPTLSGS